MDQALAVILNAFGPDEHAPPRIICIDGPAGSGKTSLAQALSGFLKDSVVVHMDDLYEGWANPLSPQLFERIRDEVLLPHLRADSIEISPWNWSAHERGSSEVLPKASVLILEGVGACTHLLRTFATLSVFVDDDSKVAIERAISRDGETLRPELMRWLTDQTIHFTEDETRTQCDVILRPLID